MTPSFLQLWEGLSLEMPGSMPLPKWWHLSWQRDLCLPAWMDGTFFFFYVKSCTDTNLLLTVEVARFWISSCVPRIPAGSKLSLFCNTDLSLSTFWRQPVTFGDMRMVFHERDKLIMRSIFWFLEGMHERSLRLWSHRIAKLLIIFCINCKTVDVSFQVFPVVHLHLLSIYFLPH